MNDSTTFKTWEDAVCWLREQPAQHDLVRAAYYDDPLIGAATRYWRSEEWQAVRLLLPAARGQALDVGAGRGIASFALAQDGFRVTALEPDGSAVVGAAAIRALAHTSGLPIEVTQEFSERLPFADASFDLVFARAVLHHTQDLPAACREFLRVLKPGGLLIAVREHVISRAEDLPAFFEVHPLHKLYGGEKAFPVGQYQAAIAGAGFQGVKTLEPWDTAINYAPHTLNSLRAELASRVGRRIPGAATIVQAMLPLLWGVLRPLLNAVDRRPGRLYSFVAEKPTSIA
jgi:SAM-dependent methyltransferase